MDGRVAYIQPNGTINKDLWADDKFKASVDFNEALLN
jgi:hypothetical protein